MDNQIHSLVEGTLVHRCGEGAVDDQVRAGTRVPRAGEQREIGDAQIWIGGRLGQDHLRPAGAQGAAQRRLVPGLDQRRLDAEPGEKARDELPRTPVAVLGEDDVISSLEKLEEGGGGGSHPAGEERGIFGALQRGELLLRGADGGVSVPAVFLALDVALEVPLDLRGVGEGVGGGPDDRGGDGVVRLVARLTPVHGESPGLRFFGTDIGHGGQPSRPPRWLKKKPSRLE